MNAIQIFISIILGDDRVATASSRANRFQIKQRVNNGAFANLCRPRHTEIPIRYFLTYIQKKKKLGQNNMCFTEMLQYTIYGAF